MSVVKEWYRAKFRIKVFTLASGNHMAFEDRLVYSVLSIFRRGLSQKKLAVITRLDRSKTIPKALGRLTRQGLAVCQDGRFHAQEPPAGLFSVDPTRTAEHWRGRLNYFTMVMPSEKCPLTIRQTALFFMLHSSNAVDSPSLLAKWLGFSRRGVIYMFQRLRGLGLIDPLKHPIRPDDEKLLWWQDNLKVKRGKLVTATGTFTFRDFPTRFQPAIKRFRERPEDWAVEDWPGIFRQIGLMCEQAGYSFAAVDRLLWETFTQLNHVPAVARFVRHLPKLIEEAEKRTARNRANKTYHYSTSFGLLKLKVKDFVKATMRAAS
jgi:hypothetical protein